MKISKIHFSYLRNEAHYQFLLLVKKLFETFPSVAGLVNTLLPQFYALLTLEGKLVDAVKSSEYTQQMVEADRRLDRAVVGLQIAIQAALHLPTPAAVNAARGLENRLKAFRGEIEKKAYEEESAAVKILVTDLQSSYASQVSLLGLGVWVVEIAAAQADFERIFLLRIAEQDNLPKETTKEVRKQIEAVYNLIIERINAYTVLNGESVTGLFITRLNAEIAYFNEHNHHHPVPKEISLTIAATIGNQVWDGHPVTPLPILTYEGHELVFAHDFDVTYENNDQPGNATLIIHGKGSWTGKKIITFDIVGNG
jgi:hypothetical protein